MAKNIISSYSSFQERFGIQEGKDTRERLGALKRYFARGGVISAVKASEKHVWPKLLYPSILRIDAQIKELAELKDNYGKRLAEWKGKQSSAKSYHRRHQVMKFSEPLYWQHTAKSLTDKDYSEDARKVGLPVHLSADPKWKPMINMFINDLEYRKNLVETVQTSIVYKKDKKVAKYADVLIDLRSEISEARLSEFNEKLKQVEEELAALKAIRKWAQE
ncbi:MAG: hypothetical protein HY544_04685 [Candidatus Diapherotrites archaeon]|uniref:Uncharacterized protein n=1 Tax=Candidatus Iainarchaeum sp. TaxID=3101447 RepID=A0A8T3YJR6_9ARCH|nr:hypothetical protein [Candidatus Diapherotrites archaeon]